MNIYFWRTFFILFSCIFRNKINCLAKITQNFDLNYFREQKTKKSQIFHEIFVSSSFPFFEKERSNLTKKFEGRKIWQEIIEKTVCCKYHCWQRENEIVLVMKWKLLCFYFYFDFYLHSSSKMQKNEERKEKEKIHLLYFVKIKWTENYIREKIIKINLNQIRLLTW